MLISACRARRVSALSGPSFETGRSSHRNPTPHALSCSEPLEGLAAMFGEAFESALEEHSDQSENTLGQNGVTSTDLSSATSPLRAAHLSCRRAKASTPPKDRLIKH